MSHLGLITVLLAVLALAGAGWALRQAGRARATTGLPRGRLVYGDTGDWRPSEAPLFSKTYGLTGKPDYLINTRAGLIPVEVKSSPSPPEPYPSHVLQLAAYCLLVEEAEGRKPPYGLIKYAEAVFEVAYTPALRRGLLGVLDSMRRARHGRVLRSHDEPQRCAGCGYRTLCDQSLV